jgi:hypothetical protein
VLHRFVTVLAALVLGGGSAWALTACGQDGGGRIDPADAAAITTALQGAREAYAGGDCDRAAALADEARAAAVALPGSVDRELRARINDGFRALDDELRPDCEAAVTTETLEELPTQTDPPATTQTEPPETTATEPPEPTAPTTTAPATPTTEEPLPEPDQPDSGGVYPDGAPGGAVVPEEEG